MNSDKSGSPDPFAAPDQTGTNAANADRGLLEAGRASAFLATLVHELRNMIAPIRNAVHVMRLRGAADPSLRSMADIMERQVLGIDRALNALVDADRLIRGELAVERAPVQLAAVIDEAVRLSRPLIERRKQLLHLTVAAPAATVHADAVRLIQVLTSLLENAAKYTGEGGEIWLDEFATATEVCVGVRDNGAGMPPELLSHIFDLFGAPESARQTRRNGLGLGLPVARELVRLHQGRIEASSAGHGKGSAFVLFLPALRGQSDVAETVSAPGKEKAQAPQSMPSRNSPRLSSNSAKRVLIADDNAALRESLCSMVREMGNDARIAADGAQALEMARNWLPGLVLLDVNMPGLNGLEVARELRAAFPPATMKLVMMSGDSLNQTSVSSAKQAGFDHCIDKIDALAAIEKLLENEP